jgi:putative tryptophan/tyrosine transport system substrate-binding protein
MKLAALPLSGVLALSLFAAPLAADAQPARKVYRIGVLTFASPLDQVERERFLKALRELGHVPGQNLVLEDRWAGTDRLPVVAAELAGLNVDVMVTYGWPAAKAAKEATGTVPVVFAVGSDPVKRGLVASLARPGGNLTGVVGDRGNLDDKRLEHLREAVPGASRLAYFSDANYPTSTWAASWAAPRLLGLQVQFLGVKGPGDFMVATVGGAARGRRSERGGADRVDLGVVQRTIGSVRVQ